MWLRERHLRPELMDQPDLPDAELVPALHAIRRVNVVSRTAAFLWPYIAAEARSAGGPLTLLDAATGSGDVPLGLARKAAASGISLRIDAFDINPRSLQIGASEARRKSLPVRFFTHDITAADLAGRYDVVLSTLFLHHLERTAAIEALSRLQQAAGRLLLVDDLRRSYTGFAAAALATSLLTRSRVARVDGLRSVRGSFTPAELAGLAREAGIARAEIRPHFPFRQLLIWRRDSGSGRRETAPAGIQARRL